MTAAGGLARTLSGAAFLAIALAMGAILFLVIWLVVSPFEPPAGPFLALMVIGVLSLVLAAGSYFAQAAVAQPLMARAASWGFLAMGFTVLFVTDGLYPDGAIGLVTRLILAFVFLVFLAVAVGGIYWRSGQLAAEQRRTEARKEWAAQPPVSAFDYKAAHPANVPPPSGSGTTAAAPPEK
ncbi:MAG TPA: hypothetical protein VGV89_01265 [Thermoplasmata archaeon]|nr:hypothetical protein [Thermoplasmata archaeon]